MADSVVLPDGRIIHKVYSFTMEHEGYHVVVGFLNFGRYEHSGADHSFESELRRDFARTLLSLPPAPARNLWLPLPEHEYLDKLKGNDFKYVAYNICTLEAAKRKHISVKADAAPAPEVYSPLLFPRGFPL